MKAGWRDAPLRLWDLAEAISIMIIVVVIILIMMVLVTIINNKYFIIAPFIFLKFFI